VARSRLALRLDARLDFAHETGGFREADDAAGSGPRRKRFWPFPAGGW
jgi:hypothetical protein